LFYFIKKEKEEKKKKKKKKNSIVATYLKPLKDSNIEMELLNIQAKTLKTSGAGGK